MVAHEEQVSAPGEAIAIVGMACRFPGAEGLTAFWRLLEAGESGVVQGVPGSGVGRIGALFPEGTGKAPACRFGAYLDNLDRFDAAFFHISPVEAQFLDPQQRMMLETCWHALEDAGIDPNRLKGSRTGVYAGISNNEYRGLILERTRPDEPAASLYSVTGTSFNTAIGRVAYALGFEGPALALDTACSSSLVAIHQAIAGLQRREADLALAGGVHAIFSGQLLEMRANAGMLSPDGRCATFDAAANGYVRGEGCGIVALKRLADAEADGDRIWAVVRGSALNQDGASPGLTVPSGPAQERVIRAALQRAGLSPSDVDYVEAHGTGTDVGDPIEAQATGTAYGRGRNPDRPLLIGSVKTNIGHLEAAAGVAGVIKTVLAMRQGVIPRHLHFQDPSPKIDWDRLPLEVTATPTPWPQFPGIPPRAGVSGFGWSGTNAHVVLEGYGDQREGFAGGPVHGPSGSPRAITVSLSAASGPVAGAGLHPRGTRLLPLSGRSGAVLRELAKRYLAWLEERADILTAGDSGTDLLADMAWTAAVGRSHFDHRAAVVFRDAASLSTGLRQLSEANGTEAAPAARKVAFAYTGQASQWPGMGEALYASEPVFRAVLDRCDAVLVEERGASLLDVMFGRPGASGDLDDPQWKQPAIYALECALTELWASLGVRPDVLVGHSLGEIAAAHTGGVFGLEDGLRFATARGELIGGLPGEGAMAAVFAPAPRVAEALDAHNAACADNSLCIAADNGAHQVVSGPAEQIAAFQKTLEAQGLRVARLRRSPAYHSAMVDPALDALEAVLAGINFRPSSIPFVSNLTGRAFEADAAPDAAYWRRQAREPVAFRACVETLAEMGVDSIVEIGPHAVLGPMVTITWPEDDGAAPPVALSSLLRPAKDEEPPRAGSGGGFVEAVAGAYQAGLSLCFDGMFAGEERRRIALADYPFEREPYWVEGNRRRSELGHPLLGARHESASGEIAFDSEIFPADPAWLGDHRVFGRVIAPGALYGAMAASMTLAEGAETAVVEEFAMYNALVLADEETENGAADAGRRMQVLVDDAADDSSRRVRILSRRGGEDDWTLHAEGRVSTAAVGLPDGGAALDVEELKASLSEVDIAAYYRAKAAVGIELGPSFRTIEALWARAGEALAEVALPPGYERGPLEVHPLVLDGCFQAFGAARNPDGGAEDATYLPFAWERLWLAGRLPERLICHVRMKESPQGVREDVDDGDELPEVHAADMRLFDSRGAVVGELAGFTVKRATRAALLLAAEGIDELLYEVVWQDCPLAPGITSADFLTSPSEISANTSFFPEYLANEGVDADDRVAMVTEMGHLADAYALATLDKLGWKREADATVQPAELRESLGVGAEHEQLFRRMLEMVARAGVLEESGEGFAVAVASNEPWPEGLTEAPDAMAGELAARYPHGATEIGLFRRSGAALADVLKGRMDPLTLLFSSGEPTAADLYVKAAVSRAANRLLTDAAAALLSDMPEGRRLRVLEVGAGTGSATAAILPELPKGRYDYTYTDISAGFFAEAETRFGGVGASIDYRVLDIEKDPVEQGFDRHGYDLVIASNVLHATRYLNETLAHCLELLAPSGQLVALENMLGQGWLDLTFGQLDGWWRFADKYRPHHALAEPAVWRHALVDAGFEDIAILGVHESDPNANPDRGVIVAQGPAQVKEAPGMWVLAADRGNVAAELAAVLAAHNQTVILAGAESPPDRPREAGGTVVEAFVEAARRESWKSLLDGLPVDPPLVGIVHLAGLDGHGAQATTQEMAEDVCHAAGSALALTQALVDSDLTLSKGLWFLTRGAQVLERERGGQLAGATLWGFGKVAAPEAPQLQPRMLDLDPANAELPTELADEFLHPDAETQIAHRFGRRRGARLVRAAAVTDRLSLPEDPGWVLEPDPGGSLDAIGVASVPERRLGPGEVRAAIEAFGLNFRDLLIAIGVADGFMGGEFCGRILEIGEGVTRCVVGDRVVGMSHRSYGSETVTLEDMVVPAPPGFSVTELATIPSAFVSAALSFELSGLDAGDRVLIHAGAGGFGLAAIQMAQAGGAEVFATASARKRDYLRSLGVSHVFDSRTTAFAQDVLDATDGAGVNMVLNSLTGEGFIEASLECLAEGGRFVEAGRMGILSEDEMAAARPDVSYAILMADVLKEEEPARVGEILGRLMDRFEAGELAPLLHARWPLAEAGPAMKCMQNARHIGKIVFTNSPLARGRLRDDRSYLVTGGLGGIGCAVAGWLAGRGAGTIVLNGRRPPDPEIEEQIEALRQGGADIRVELADVTDAPAVDAMLARVDADLPPLVGVIHSVGVLSDAAIGNQRWEDFETVMWPKVLGAWHLHRATVGRDLDLFVLFSSAAGVLGNPGQANHAAANAFLDQLAAHRRAVGLAGQAIAWGAWSEIGEAEEQRERIVQRFASGGLEWIAPQQGIRALDRLVREDSTAAVVLARDWVALGESLDSRPQLLEHLLTDSTDEGADESSGEDILSRLREAPATMREELLASFLQEEVKAVLRLPATPAPTVGFFDLGLDSLMAVELRNRLNRAFTGNYTASNTVVFDYPDIAALSAHLADELAGVVGERAPSTQPEPTPMPARPSPAAQPDDKDLSEGIAIVGMACRFPGGPDLPAFWRHLESGLDPVVTDERRESGPWSDFADSLPAQYAPYMKAAFVDGIDRFDARFFGIAPVAARLMDPQQRMLLETAWQALEDAGIDPDRLKGSSTGVYAGIASSEYRDLMRSEDYGIGYLSTAASMAVGRISYHFGLTGPVMPVGLNCASSLVAVHQAVTDLRQGVADLALVGGASAVLSAPVTREMADLGLLSREGVCRTFGSDADGFVRGEGCGMVVLKRLSDAEADGDRIWAVIRGSAVNHNGAAAGATVPNGPAQERVIVQALSQAGFAPSEVDYLEAHGAGSELGDPIEVKAAAAVYGKGRTADRPLLIGSVKTNIGHLESAAGVASLIKTVLAMSRGTIPRHLNFRTPSPLIEWDRLPVRVTEEATDWPSVPDRPPRAGVSAFGISGVNAHVVLEGYGAANGIAANGAGAPAPAGSARPVTVSLPEVVVASAQDADALTARETRLLPLSGKSQDALKALADRYLSWLDEHAGEASSDLAASDPLLSDMAWTAGVGRSHLEYRAGVLFHDAASLRARLAAFASTEDLPKSASVARIAFAYPDDIGGPAGMIEALYRSEPVIRGVLDRCDAVIREERGESLLDAMFDRAGAEASLDDSAWARPARYALACALTALWSSVGIRPNVVFGNGAGAIAAARPAGAFTLEDGLRLAAALHEPETMLEGVAIASPAIALISSITGRLLDSGEVLGPAYWRRQAQETASVARCADTLAELGVDAVIEIGRGTVLGATLLLGRTTNGTVAPVAIGSLKRPPNDEDSPGGNPVTRADGGFVAAVAEAYEAGLPVSFAGLFAGETRRRIALPGYPFQRRSHWLAKREP